MKRRVVAAIFALVLAMSLAACGGGEETTVSGMVVSVEGTVVTLMDMGDMNFEAGERPEGMEGFGNFGDFNPGDFENFDPENFEGSFPEGEMPQWGEGERPEMPEGMTLPEGMEDMTRPADGEMPEWSEGMEGMVPGMGGFEMDGETSEVDIAGAHISVEIDGGKASGSMEDIGPGTFVTITLNGKGEATYVLISSMFRT